MADVTQLSTNWQVRLFSTGDVLQGVDAIDQSIGLVVKTSTNELPLQPDFGIPWLEILDLPLPLAAARIVREVMAAIARWERRARVLQVLPIIEDSTIRVRVLWTPEGSTDQRETEVQVR
jgi:phage baseplate assembly protein W